VRVYAGVDAGRVENRVAGIPDGTLAGAALGLNIAWKRTSLDVSATRALHEPHTFQREGTQTWVRLNIEI
jgi:hemolysin activation/secretion protein